MIAFCRDVYFLTPRSTSHFAAFIRAILRPPDLAYSAVSVAPPTKFCSIKTRGTVVVPVIRPKAVWTSRAKLGGMLPSSNSTTAGAGVVHPNACNLSASNESNFFAALQYVQVVLLKIYACKQKRALELEKGKIKWSRT